MFKLFQLELYTLFSRKLITLLIVLMFSFLSINIYDDYKNKQYSDDWKSELHKDIQKQIQEMKNKNNTEEAKKYFAVNIQKDKLYLEKNINPYKKNQYTFMQKNLNFLPIIPLFIIMLSSFVFYKEYKYNTIKNIKLATISSFNLVITKFLALAITSTIIFSCFYLLCYICGGLVNGWTHFHYTFITQDQDMLQINNSFIYLTKIFLSDYLVSLFFISLMSMLIALTKSSTISLILSMSLLFFYKILFNQLSSFQYTKYTFFNTLNIRKFAIQTSTFALNSSALLSLILNIIYIMLFLIVTIFFYKRIRI